VGPGDSIGRSLAISISPCVAVQGIGGLGHLGVQFSRRMGFHTVAIGPGRDEEKLAKELGARVYIDADREGASVLQRMGTARAILATGTSGAAMGPLVSGLAAREKLIVFGASADPIQLSALPLLFGGCSICGSLTGTPILCSICSSWRAGAAATHREHKPYLIACPFDPHRPYQSSFFPTIT
jgi:D-arabinose 1-dehydrogenase-like Zn-dependent alcohol dehydrogenase